jgi:hypothetical protein
VNLRSLYPTLLRLAGINDVGGVSLFDQSAPANPVVSQYLELHVKELARRFDAETLAPYRERLQSSFSSTHQLLVGEDGLEELLSRDEGGESVDDEDAVRKQLRATIPPFENATTSRQAVDGGPDEEMLRSLGYLE